jgi:hypothetical protein
MGPGPSVIHSNSIESHFMDSSQGEFGDDSFKFLPYQLSMVKKKYKLPLKAFNITLVYILLKKEYKQHYQIAGTSIYNIYLFSSTKQIF